MDLYLLGEGRHLEAWKVLGARLKIVDGVAGCLFAVWAPAVQRVNQSRALVGTFVREKGSDLVGFGQNTGGIEMDTTNELGVGLEGSVELRWTAAQHTGQKGNAVVLSHTEPPCEPGTISDNARGRMRMEQGR